MNAECRRMTDEEAKSDVFKLKQAEHGLKWQESLLKVTKQMLKLKLVKKNCEAKNWQKYGNAKLARAVKSSKTNAKAVNIVKQFPR